MKQLTLQPEKAQNRAMANDLRNKDKAHGTSLVQTKLTVGELGDKYEQEADQVADKVMSMPEPKISKAPADDEDKIQAKPITSQITPLVQRQPEEEEEPLQTKLIQKQEDNESLQAQYIQRASQEEDDKLQTKLIQRQPEEEEEPIQAQYIQKQPEEEEEPLQTKLISRKGETSVPQESNWLENQLQSSKGSGSPLPNDIKTSMETRFGTDFSQVKIHTGTSAVKMNKELNAQAFTHGNDVYFNSGKYSPESSSGKHLLAHELTHTIQQGKTIGKKIQRVQPTDVSSEMVGQKFILLEDQTAENTKTIIPKGTTVTIIQWTNTGHEVKAVTNISTMPFIATLKVDKKNLQTTGSAASGLSQYKAGVSTTQSEIVKGEKAIGAHKAKEAEYKKFKNEKGYQKELARLEGLQDNRYDTLNENLIQETMFNRFDPTIKFWVNFYNTSLKPKNDLDPEIVKSLIYEETKMGTRGVHLEMPPYGWTGTTSYPIKSRFNLGQAIDSWGPQQYLMIKEMAPTIYTKYNLLGLETGNKWKSMSNNDYATWDSGNFVKAMQEFNSYKFFGIGANLNLSSTDDLMEDYAYWIRVAIRWLFEKYFSMKSPSWSEAVRAYNGSGPKAKAYRDRIMKRVP